MQCGKTQTLFLYCDICGAVLTETPSGYLSCPSGHGKLKMRIEALLKFPKAELAAGRVYRIAGRMPWVVIMRGRRRMSRARWLQQNRWSAVRGIPAAARAAPTRRSSP